MLRSCTCGGIHQRGKACLRSIAKRKQRDATRPRNPAYDGEYTRNAKALKATYVEGESLCVRCGRLIPREELTIEHLVPLRKGGTNELRNLALACHCNYAWQRA
jgi:5-methylcytosine-specific restriction endonuclease McrA